MKGESQNLVKTFFKEETLSSVKDAVKGAALTVFGVESSGDIVSGVTKRLLPFYDDGETAMDYMKKMQKIWEIC